MRIMGVDADRRRPADVLVGPVPVDRLAGSGCTWHHSSSYQVAPPRELLEVRPELLLLGVVPDDPDRQPADMPALSVVGSVVAPGRRRRGRRRGPPVVPARPWSVGPRRQVLRRLEQALSSATTAAARTPASPRRARGCREVGVDSRLGSLCGPPLVGRPPRSWRSWCGRGRSGSPAESVSEPIRVVGNNPAERPIPQVRGLGVNLVRSPEGASLAVAITRAPGRLSDMRTARSEGPGGHERPRARDARRGSARRRRPSPTAPVGSAPRSPSWCWPASAASCCSSSASSAWSTSCWCCWRSAPAWTCPGSTATPSPRASATRPASWP